MHIAVQMARDHCENWTREKSEIGKDLQAQLNASDNLLSKLAFGADYK